jgi:hypothetical protein
VVAGVEVVAELDELDLDAARQAVLDTAAAVRAEAYEPRPNPLCDWCDFRAVCPAWNVGEGTEALGPMVAELRAKRREVAREVRDLRDLEAGVARIAAELADAEEEASGHVDAGWPGRRERTAGARTGRPTALRRPTASIERPVGRPADAAPTDGAPASEEAPRGAARQRDHPRRRARPAATVLDVITDLERYPEWAEGVLETEVLSPDDEGRPRGPGSWSTPRSPRSSTRSATATRNTG